MNPCLLLPAAREVIWWDSSGQKIEWKIWKLKIEEKKKHENPTESSTKEKQNPTEKKKSKKNLE